MHDKLVGGRDGQKYINALRTPLCDAFVILAVTSEPLYGICGIVPFRQWSMSSLFQKKEAKSKSR